MLRPKLSLIEVARQCKHDGKHLEIEERLQHAIGGELPKETKVREEKARVKNAAENPSLSAEWVMVDLWGKPLPISGTTRPGMAIL